jgi:PAS domain S-box-containing protein
MRTRLACQSSDPSARRFRASRTPGSRSASRGGGREAGWRYRAGADLFDGYVHESRFERGDQSAEHRIVWASEGFAAVFGCTVEEYNRGALWGGRYHPDELGAAMQRAAALRRGESVEAELKIVRGRGETRWLHVKNRPIFDPATGAVTGVLGIGQDITRRKLAEQACRDAQRALGDVAERQGVAREIIAITSREQQRIAQELDGLGQELTGVALLLRSLAEETSRCSAQLRESMDGIIGFVNRAIGEACMLARSLSPVELDHGGLPYGLTRLAERSSAPQRVDVCIRCPEESLAFVTAAAAEQLYRIAEEAVSNAVRHSQAQNIRISLLQYADHVYMSVIDDGCGISAHHHAGTDAADPRNPPPAPGTPAPGMGLRIMQYRARMIGAQLRIERGPHGGTWVCCRLSSSQPGREPPRARPTA